MPLSVQKYISSRLDVIDLINPGLDTVYQSSGEYGKFLLKQIENSIIKYIIKIKKAANAAFIIKLNLTYLSNVILFEIIISFDIN